jgi:hypothetical protein
MDLLSTRNAIVQEKIAFRVLGGRLFREKSRFECWEGDMKGANPVQSTFNGIVSALIPFPAL